MKLSSFRPRLLGSSVFVAAAIALSAAIPVSADTSTVTSGVTAQVGGGLSASINSATSLTPVVYSFSDQDSAGTVTLTAQDSRGTGAGWLVTVETGVFTNQTDGTTLPASDLALVTGDGAATVNGGQLVDGTSGPLVNEIGSLDAARNVVSAAAEFGQGSYNQILNVSLHVPALTHVGTYTSTLTTTIATAP